MAGYYSKFTFFISCCIWHYYISYTLRFTYLKWNSNWKGIVWEKRSQVLQGAKRPNGTHTELESCCTATFWDRFVPYTQIPLGNSDYLLVSVQWNRHLIGPERNGNTWSYWLRSLCKTMHFGEGTLCILAGIGNHSYGTANIGTELE